ARHRAQPAAPAPASVAELQLRLAEAEETILAIRSGEVDAVFGAGEKSNQVFTLEGADHAYRVLIESMNEGALTLSADKVILFANHCFAKMVKCSLQQVIGSSFLRFLSPEDRATLEARLKRAGVKFQALLVAANGTSLAAQISIRSQKKNGPNGSTLGVVVTDMTEARRSEGLLRALTHRVVQVQEAERQRVGFELHDNITQLLCAVVFRSQSLVDRLPANNGASKGDAIRLRDMLGTIAQEVVRISHNLGPSSLKHLGLVTTLRDAKTEFSVRTGVSVKLTCQRLTAHLPADTELALYRILQEALGNVEKHAGARHVTVSLRQRGAFVQLLINDDGVGFNRDRPPAERRNQGGLGLLSMRERATYVGGTLVVKSGIRGGTEVNVLVPLRDRRKGRPPPAPGTASGL
ncbi:MAG TPA: ATP-binding protein, partial [Opitutaceae bacterium]